MNFLFSATGSGVVTNAAADDVQQAQRPDEDHATAVRGFSSSHAQKTASATMIRAAEVRVEHSAVAAGAAAAASGDAGADSIRVRDGLDLLRTKQVSVGVAAAETSDVVPGCYEGGAKLWGSAVDLVLWLDEQVTQGLLDVRGKRVLELGCGHGMPGVYCMAHAGAGLVVFQDLNAEVLRQITARNLAMNGCSGCLSAEANVDEEDDDVVGGKGGNACRFVCGDWRDGAMRETIGEAGSFDLILASDTIYSTEYLPYFVQLVVDLLDKHGGAAIIGAQRYYFGVGGSTADLVAYVEEHYQGEVKMEQLGVIDNGQSNIREIWRMSHSSRV